jgi:hypothetical protein
MAPWTYCQVIDVVTQKCQENRIHLVKIPPAYNIRQECVSMGGRETEENALGENTGQKSHFVHVAFDQKIARKYRFFDKKLAAERRKQGWVQL